MSKLLFALTLLLLTILVACSDDKSEADKTDQLPPPVDLPYFADEYLPPDNPTYEIERLKPLETVTATETADDTTLGHSLTVLRYYSFVGQSRTTYNVGGETLSVEISQFATVPDAYGYFSRQRPYDATPIGIGKDSWAQGPHTWFIDDHCVVTISTSSESTKELGAQSIIAREIETNIVDTDPLPIFVKMFPDRDRIFGSTRYHPRDFLDIEGLDEAYSTLYDIDGDTVIFFMIFDSTDQSFIDLNEHAREVGTVNPAPDTLNFPRPEFALEYDDPAHGPIVAGMVRKKLVGIVGWDYSRLQWLGFVWVLGLK
ncbi:hypothetical protein GF356_09010 [candidate division GN15 bacterium]|nr:hypothetical protein [candidate division GN15 bacterium]